MDMMRVDVHRVTDQVERNIEQGRNEYYGLTSEQIKVYRRWRLIKKRLSIDDSVETCRRLCVCPNVREWD